MLQSRERLDRHVAAEHEGVGPRGRAGKVDVDRAPADEVGEAAIFSSEAGFAIGATSTYNFTVGDGSYWVLDVMTMV